MQIYFVRHGKTEWNLAQRFQGAHGDSPLLPQSLTDIQKLANYLQGTEFAALYASPLKRALATAKGLEQNLQINLPLKVDERLREFDLGKMEGLNFVEANSKYPEQVKDIWQRPDKYDGHGIGGEDYQDVIVRGQSFARMLAEKYQNPADKILVVSHGAALSAIMGGLLAYPLKDIRQNGGLSNTSLSILETTDQGANFKVLKWNETSFLGRKITRTDSL